MIFQGTEVKLISLYVSRLSFALFKLQTKNLSSSSLTGPSLISTTIQEASL